MTLEEASLFCGTAHPPAYAAGCAQCAAIVRACAQERLRVIEHTAFLAEGFRTGELEARDVPRYLAAWLRIPE